MAIGNLWSFAVDIPDVSAINTAALYIMRHTALQTALHKGKGEEATRYYELSQETISNATDEVDWYQVLLHHIPDEQAAASLQALWGALFPFPSQAAVICKQDLTRCHCASAAAVLRTTTLQMHMHIGRGKKHVQRLY